MALAKTRTMGPSVDVRSRSRSTALPPNEAALTFMLMHAELSVPVRVWNAHALCPVTCALALGAAADPCVASTVSLVTPQFAKVPLEKSSAKMKVGGVNTVIGLDAALSAHVVERVERVHRVGCGPSRLTRSVIAERRRRRLPDRAGATVAVDLVRDRRRIVGRGRPRQVDPARDRAAARRLPGRGRRREVGVDRRR